MSTHSEETLDAIAVVGMSCRFPGADSVAEFWENLKQGVCSISEFSEDELTGVEPELVAQPNYVKASGVLKDIHGFDAAFFGLSPKEATLMDPQQRKFLEVGWEALENAGYQANDVPGPVGVYAGSDTSGHLYAIMGTPEFAASDKLTVEYSTQRDHLAPRLSYFLNLRGPSIPVQTACSTSLVAIHVATQSLLNHECDMALAGGSSVPVPHKSGYLYAEGSILSPDGKCRSFDASAKGTVPGSGVGVVVLKRLEDALESGDQIYAVIRGTAVNNDGSDKMGYTAPGLDGQRRCLSEALAISDLEASDISYVETHGTATSLGDPLEIEALKQAYDGAEPGSIAIGAVKSNLGHCNAAAGVAGFMKTVLCLHHKTLVPTANFQSPNPKCGFEGSPFAVNTESRDWDGEDGSRFAGVSSFGIGGTNAHAILGEAPAIEPSDAANRETQLICLSAKTAEALDQIIANHKTYLGENPDTNLADYAFTLAKGRKGLTTRTSFAANSVAALLEAFDGKIKPATVDANKNHDVVFLFPGQGADYKTFGADLYKTESVFRETVDTCCDILKPFMDGDLRDFMFAEPESSAWETLHQPQYWQPAIYVSSYASAQLVLSQGIEPKAMIGHSIGEFVAATLSGVLKLEDALQLIARRGKGTQSLDGGAMLAAVTSEETARGYLADGVDVAAINGPKLNVYSGTVAAIEDLRSRLKEDRINTIVVPTTHAFHSHMMDPLVPVLTELAGSFQLGEPKIPYISNVTGTWMTAQDATDPAYWGRHLRGAVRFSDGLEALFQEEGGFPLEVGPGQTLSKLATRHPSPSHKGIALMGDAGDQSAFIGALGQLWENGYALDMDTLFGEGRRLRLALPTYPWERSTFKLELPEGKMAGFSGASDPNAKLPQDDWFYRPTWTQEDALYRKPVEGEGRWLVFCDASGYMDALCDRLKELGQDVYRVHLGEEYEEGEDRAVIHRDAHNHYTDLFKELQYRDWQPTHILHGFLLDPVEIDTTNLQMNMRRGFDSLVLIAQNLSSTGMSSEPIHLSLISNRLQEVRGGEGQPYEASALGATRILPLELTKVTTTAIDLDVKSPAEVDCDVVLSECRASNQRLELAYRDGVRYISGYSKASLPAAEPVTYEPGLYLITNGLRQLGMTFAQHIKDAGGTPVILDRSFFPAEDEWDDWIRDQGAEEYISRRIVEVRALKAAGYDFDIRTANFGDPHRVNRLMDELTEQYGPLRGICHIYTAPDTGLLQLKQPGNPSPLLNAKMADLIVLESVIAKHKPNFLALSGENRGLFALGQAEQAGYYAAMARFGQHLNRHYDLPVHAIEWGTRSWTEITEGDANIPEQMMAALEEKQALVGITPAEHMAVFERILGLRLPAVIVSTTNYADVLVGQLELTTDFYQNQMSAGGVQHDRPEQSAEYEAASTDTERAILAIWEDEFAISGIGIHDNFFELGGHSLLAVQLMSRVNKAVGAALTMDQLFDAPTVHELAQLASGEEDGEDDMEALLASIEGLSDEEIEAVLAQEGADDEEEDQA